MNDTQENSFSMFLRCETRLDNNLSIVNTLPALATARTGFKTRINNIRAVDLIVTAPVTGVTMDKETVRKTLITACIQQSSTLCAYAGNIGNNTLYQEVYKAESDIRKLRDDQFPTYATLIATRQSDNLASLADYGVTAPSIAAFQNIISLYTSASPMPRSAINTRKAAVTNLKNQFKDANSYLKKVVDKLVITFKTTQPDFVEQYFNDRNIIDDGSSGSPLQTIQHTIDIAVTKSEGPLPAGASSMKVTNLAGGPLEFGLSTAGTVFSGNTATLGAPGSQTYPISYFASAGNIILVRNQNLTVQGEYKIEIFG